MSYIRDLQKYPEGHYFYKEAMKMVDKFDTDTYIEEGIVRWKDSNNIPLTDILELWEHFNKPFSYERTIEVRNKETIEMLNKYRENKTYSQEELFEMKSAFGENETIVDVITGKEIIL